MKTLLENFKNFLLESRIEKNIVRLLQSPDSKQALQAQMIMASLGNGVDVEALADELIRTVGNSYRNWIDHRGQTRDFSRKKVEDMQFVDNLQDFLNHPKLPERDWLPEDTSRRIMFGDNRGLPGSKVHIDMAREYFVDRLKELQAALNS